MATVSPRISEPPRPGNVSPRGYRDAKTPAPTVSGQTSPRSSTPTDGAPTSSNAVRSLSPRGVVAGAPRGASPFVRPRSSNRPPPGPGAKRTPGGKDAISPREDELNKAEEEVMTKPDTTARPSPASAAFTATHVISATKGEHFGSIEQAHAMIRVLAAQADEARADKTAMWEQTRNDAKAMAQVAKNIEGNQSVLAKVVTTLEAQLVAARTEKDAALEASRADKKTWERLLRESERQLREVEKQRDRAQADAVAANAARKAAQEALETARRSESELVRAVQVEKAAMAKELKDLRGAAQSEWQRTAAATEDVGRLASGLEALQSALGVSAYGDGGDGGTAAALREAREARDVAERAKEALRAQMQAELVEAVRKKEEALGLLAAAQAGALPDIQRLQALLDASHSECERERNLVAEIKREVREEREAREKLLVQARLDNVALSSREREHSQQLEAKAVQVAALERQLSTMAGQLVGAQAEAKKASDAASAAEATTMRERTMLVEARQTLQNDKAELQARLQAAELQKSGLLEQLAQGAADRDFCFEMIKELKGQVQAAYAQ